MPELKPQEQYCDVLGCGRSAVLRTDGSEVDAQTDLNRPALPNLHVCNHHRNWPHSNDAKIFVLQNEQKYAARKVG